MYATAQLASSTRNAHTLIGHALVSERVHFQEPAHRLFPAFVGLPHRVAEIHPSKRRETGHHLTRIGPRASRDLIGGRAYLRCRAYSAALIGFRLPRRRTAASPVGAKSDASFFQRKAPPKRTEKYQTVVYDSIKVPCRGSHHAEAYFSGSKNTNKMTTFRNKKPRGSHGSGYLRKR